MRYWLYKCNVEGGPAGYSGNWSTMVFDKAGPIQWGGSYATLSPEVLRYLDDEIAAGDVIIAYQTDLKSVVGYCRLTNITGLPGNRKLYLQPIELLDQPFRIHERKVGTRLAASPAVNGPVMLRELDLKDMETLVSLARSPRRVLRGEPSRAGWKPGAGKHRDW